MKQILRYSLMALLAVFCGSSFAQEVTFDFSVETNPWGLPTDKLEETGTFTKDGMSIVITTTNYTRWFDDTKVLLFGKKDATITLPAFDFDVERIDVVGASKASGKVTFNIFVGDEAVSTEVTGAQGTAKFVIAEGKQAAGTVYVIKNTNDNNNQISKILIWKKGTTGDAPAAPTVSDVAALNALNNGDAFTFSGEALVVYASGRYAYIKDETGSSLIYSGDVDKLANLEKGKKIAANWTGKISVYKNLFEAVPDAVLTVTDDEAVEVTYPAAEMTDVTADNMNQVVVLKDVIYTTPDEKKNFTISQGETEVKGYNQFGLEISEPVAGKSYDITGVISVYNDNVQFQPIDIQEVSWTVAGTAPLADNSWKPEDTSADMTSTDGVNYTYVKEGITLEKGVTYEFKVARNHGWAESYPGQNYPVTVDETAEYKVTISFNALTKEVAVETEKTGAGQVNEKVYSVIGTINGNWDTDTDMTLGDDGLYKAKFTDVAQGNYKLKVRVNHDWGECYGGGDDSDGNSVFDVESDGSTVTVTFNEETKEVKITVDSAAGEYSPYDIDQNGSVNLSDVRKIINKWKAGEEGYNLAFARKAIIAWKGAE